MKKTFLQTSFYYFISISLCSTIFAIEPNQIMIIANSDCPESVSLANYYCRRRNVPTDNIFTIALGENLPTTISRPDYQNKLVIPLRARLYSQKFAGKIKCILTTYGVPLRVDKRPPLKNQQRNLRKLRELLEKEKAGNNTHKSPNNLPSKPPDTSKNHRIEYLQSRIDRIHGKETNASLDSELAMMLFDKYDLYRWQPNKLKKSGLLFDFKTLMVCRLDAPSPPIARSLIDKAINAEKHSLKGTAYIDSRGISGDGNPGSFARFDKSLRDLALLTASKTELPVRCEKTEKLFQKGQCPNTALYCGWYSLEKYIDAFDFVDGAVGYHISSLEAVDLRNQRSSQWCPAMLEDGITATIGAVAEPYLLAFPEPKDFFSELFDGSTLVEAFYRTKPCNSWQLVLIGDPLYKPFPSD